MTKEELRSQLLDVLRLGNIAVREAQEENRRMGIPNAYFINGRHLFQMPDGHFTEENPFSVLLHPGS